MGPAAPPPAASAVGSNGLPPLPLYPLYPIAPAPPPAGAATDEHEAPEHVISSREQTRRRRFGLHANLYGPSSDVGVGGSMQVTPLVEVLVSLGYLGRTNTEQSAAATAEGNVRLLTPLAKARLWFNERHNFIVEGGAGLSFVKVTADGESRDKVETLHYERTGNPGIFVGGIGYGYRAPGPLRFSVVVGYQLMTGKLGDSAVSSSPQFSAADRAKLKADFDNATDDFGSLNRLYLELSLGFLF
jgi:hypothetical protein